MTKLLPIIISLSILFAVGCKTTDSRGTFPASRLAETGEFTSDLEDEEETKTVSDGGTYDFKTSKVVSRSLPESSETTKARTSGRQPIKVSRTIVFRTTPSASGETELRYTDTSPAQDAQPFEQRESILSRSLRYAAIWIVILIIGYGIFKIYKTFPVAPKPSPTVFKENVREKDGVVAPVTEPIPAAEPPTKRMREF